jgi:hypothetical protein
MSKWPELLSGTIVSVPTYVFFRHVGIVSNRWLDGKPMVISNSCRLGGVFETSWDEFSQGLPVYLESKDPPGSLSRLEILHRARSVIGTRYDLFAWNCDDLVGYARGVKPNITQLKITAGLVLISYAFLATRK